MHIPFLASCGHSFCYGCLKSWFDNKVNCPTCRKELEYPPILNIQLKEISYNISELLINFSDDVQESNSMKEQRDEMQNEYDEDFKVKKLFGDAFESALTLIDNSDGVPRCGNCHWEAHGTECLHCGSRFRIPRDDSYYDSEDGDAYNEDDEEIILEGRDEEEGANEYDSEDSFIDGREFDSINRDLADRDENDILSSDEDRSDASSVWRGFDDQANAHRDSEDVGDDESEEAAFVNGELRNLLSDEHDLDLQENLSEVNVDSDEEPVSFKRARVTISSDEDD